MAHDALAPTRLSRVRLRIFLTRTDIGCKEADAGAAFASKLRSPRPSIRSSVLLTPAAEAPRNEPTMTVRRWNDNAGGTKTLAPVVLILKKTQGSVWSEAGRTPLCPTLSWLRDKYGAGQYELRLEQGNRTLCMTKAVCQNPPPPTGAQSVTPPAATGSTRSWPASGNERAPTKTVLRGTALG